MIRLNRLYPFALLALAAAPLGGCATMSHGYLTTKRQENGRDVKLEQMNLDHASPDLHIYEGDAELPIERVVDKRHHVIENALSAAAAQARVNGCLGRCTAYYTYKDEGGIGPGVYLDPTRPHTLRFVRGDQQATVTVKKSFKVRWYFLDMAWLALGPVAWVVDGVTGSWNEFPRLDVNQVFRNAMASASGTR